MNTHFKSPFYILIDSLNQTEKAYFKKYAYKGSKKDSEYITFYNDTLKLISKNKTESEIDAALKLKYKSKLSSLKNYLQKLITDCLLQYYEADDLQMQCFKFYKKSRIFMIRKQFDLSNSFLAKARKIANECEYNELKLLIEKLQVILNQAQSKVSKADFEVQEKRLKKSVDHINFHYQLSELTFKIASIAFTHYKSSSDVHLKALKNLLDHPILNGSIESNQIHFNYLKHKTIADIKHLSDKSTNYIGKLIEIVELIKPHKKWIAGNKDNYIKLLFVVLSYASNLNEFEIFENYYKEFIKQTENGNKQYLLENSYVLNLKLLQGLRTNKIEENIGLEKELNALFKRYNKTLMHTNINNAHKMAYSFMLLNFHEKASKWLSTIYQNELSEILIPYHTSARIMNLICAIEVKNYELASNQLRNVQRFLEKYKNENSIEFIILKMIKELINCTEDERKPKFEAQLNMLNALSENKTQLQKFENFFNIRCWLKSKATNTSFRNLFVENIVLQYN